MLPRTSQSTYLPINGRQLINKISSYITKKNIKVCCHFYLVLVLVDYLAGLQEEHNAKVELSTTNYA